MPRPSEYMQRNPVRLDISRSRFNMSPRWTGAFNAYKLVPIFTYTDVLPGDTFKLSTSFVVRMSTPVAPVMDDLFMDVAFYFVPDELLLSRSYMSPSTNDSNHSWKAFIGAQDSLLNMPVPDSDIQLPTMNVQGSGYVVGGIADCMGLPAPASGSYAVSALAALAFMAVWNENYRDPNVQNPGVFSISSGQVYITWGAAGIIQNVLSGAGLPNVCRYHGYFGSALPWPQRNSETVKMPLGTEAPVMVNGSNYHSMGSNPLYFGTTNAGADEEVNTYALGLSRLSGATGGPVFVSNVDVTNDGTISDHSIRYSNLVADLANASAVSINTFRLAVQEQRWYEALARGGNRIDELTAALFGVMPKDAGGNQPEYLGGKRIPLSVSQVNVTANSSAGSQNNGVGDTGAFSITSDVDYYFTKSFDRWGVIIGVACVRYRDSFGASINKQFTRLKRFDHYFPQFANLGEAPVEKYLLDVDLKTSSSGPLESDVFGYQEAWADYRYIPDIVTGLTRPGGSLQHWTYANRFDSSHGTLAAFLTGLDAKAAIDRSLVVSSETSGLQFLAQFQFDITAVRPMPLYSIPGLVDHH